MKEVKKYESTHGLIGLGVVGDYSNKVSYFQSYITSQWTSLHKATGHESSVVSELFSEAIAHMIDDDLVPNHINLYSIQIAYRWV